MMTGWSAHQPRTKRTGPLGGRTVASRSPAPRLTRGRDDAHALTAGSAGAAGSGADPVAIR